MANSDFKFSGEPVDFSKAMTMEFVPTRAGKGSGINFAWLKEFASAFGQQVEGEDGEAVGRQLWNDSDDAWRAARAVSSELAYEDAVAEAEAWNSQADAEDGACPLYGEDGGTGCGMPGCQY